MAQGDQPSGSGARRADSLVGKVIDGRFTVLEPIGSGGMGRVYKALQRPLDRLVALKVLNPAFSAGKDPGFQKRFFLEASLTSKLRHPNTITIHDYGRTEDGIFYIAMEFVEGITLQQLLVDQKIVPWQRALYICGQVARSLREAHKAGIVHRDLKPANVMVLTEESENDLVKVLDFGLVKTFAEDAPKLPDSTELTQAGVLLGSPMYMAPEQARNESDPRSDIYSLGVVLFQMIAGRPPFTGKESIDVIVKHIREKPPRLKSVKPDVPDDVDALVMRCLEKEPSKRFQSMDEVLDALRQAGGSSGVFVPPRTLSNSQLVSPAEVRTLDDDEPFPSESEVPPRPHTDRILATPMHTARPGRMRWVAAGALAGLVVVGATVLVVLLQVETPDPIEVPLPKPQVAVVPPTPVVPQPSPAPVQFHVSSEPEGARVLVEGREVGVTPFELPVPRSSAGSARATLAFFLDGYEPLTQSFEGQAERVEARAQLTKKRGGISPGKPGRPQGTKPTGPDGDGYKDDPYQ